MKKLLALLLALVMVFSLVACGNNDTPVADAPAADAPAVDAPADDNVADDSADSNEIEPCTITWGMNETANLPAESYYAIADAFMEAYPNITVEVDLGTNLSADASMGYATKVTSGLQTDICLYTADMEATEGACAAMPDWLAEKFDAGYLKETFGAVRSVPAVTQGVWCIIYDRAMFEDAGITATPTSWDEFLTVCEQLKTNGTTPMMLWGSTNQDFFALGLDAWLVGAIEAEDPEFKQKLLSGEAKWTDPIVAEKVQAMQDFANSGYIYDGFKSLDYGNALAEFYDGKAAMIMEGVWGLAGLDAEKYGIFFVPDNAGSVNTTMTTSYWQVWEGAENVDACWLFIDWLLCGEGLPLYTQYILKPDSQVGCSKFATVYEMDPLVEEYYNIFYTYNVVENWMEKAVYQPVGLNPQLYTADIFYNNQDVATILGNLQEQYDILVDEQGMR